MRRMKKSNVIRKGGLFMMTMSLCGTTLAGTPELEGNATSSNSVKPHRILVIGMLDNVKSNYFVTDMLAENTHIQEDSVCYIYNKVIEDNLAQMAQKTKSPYTFVYGKDVQDNNQELLDDIQTTGEAENQSSDLAFVNSNKLKGMLEQAGADYLLLLDSHYLKYQEEPFKTIFHYVNYSLYDANKKKLGQGSNYFTSINPQTEQQMIKSSKKSTAKMLEDLESKLKK